MFVQECKNLCHNQFFVNLQYQNHIMYDMLTIFTIFFVLETKKQQVYIFY